jgi:membrane-associated PAP2 superfamily phosphatase
MYLLMLYVKKGPAGTLKSQSSMKCPWELFKLRLAHLRVLLEKRSPGYREIGLPT